MAVMLADRAAGDRNGCSCCTRFPLKKGKQKLRRYIRRTERQQWKREARRAAA